MSNSSGFFSSVYVPKLTAEQKKIIRDAPMPKTISEVQEDIDSKIEEVTNFFQTIGVDTEPRILNENEAKSVMKSRVELISDCDRIKEKINKFNEAIDKEIGDNPFTYNFKRKPLLRKALKKITGKAKNSISYEDYRLALEIKQKLEEEEVSSFHQEEE